MGCINFTFSKYKTRPLGFITNKTESEAAKGISLDMKGSMTNFQCGYALMAVPDAAKSISSHVRILNPGLFT
jgi:hypothetical protein